MSEWTSISVTQQQKDELQDAQPENQSMGEYLMVLLDSYKDTHRDAITEGGGGVDPEKIDAIINELESLKRAVKENSQLTNRMLRELEELQG